VAVLTSSTPTTNKKCVGLKASSAKHAFARFNKLMAVGSDLVAYGPKEIARAIAYGAVESLIVATKADTRGRLARAATATGSSVLVLSDAGESTLEDETTVVAECTGVCALLRFPVDEVDEDEDTVAVVSDTDSDPDSDTGTRAGCAVVRARATPSQWTAAAVVSAGVHGEALHRLTEEAEAELESLAFIFPEDEDEAEAGAQDISLRRLGNTNTCFLAVSAGAGALACFTLTLPTHYPAVAPVLCLESNTGVCAAEVRESAAAFCEEQAGEAVLYALAIHLQELCENH